MVTICIFSRQVGPASLSINENSLDIHDSRAYQQLSKPGGFFTVTEHTGLILCSDRVQLFELAKQNNLAYPACSDKSATRYLYEC